MSLSAISRKIAELEKRMLAAAEAEDFELAARLRNEIAALRGEDGGAPAVRKPPPGEMGLGTHIPVVAPPKGWTPPKKPDPMTRGRK
ncbi:UvrB/uvrC motif-containing protein [Devosia enhydra]|uniref:UvrB/uvrC motif-containing protein n=1 Tax=Devosia enhydra TaxID=665118 RepID=A0A1K2HX28_9HYPH|nr:UvrB/UvrC motif-containing protein [Devosia enhydra]SFZ83707.1 UvrB/uvrC motif-containing protein [Devosia enhydra]